MFAAQVRLRLFLRRWRLSSINSQGAACFAIVLGIVVLVACHAQIHLDANCEPDWPVATCYAGNLAGLCSTVLWFGCLVPQVILNFKRKPFVGLSPWWAAANFLASFVNLNFILRLRLPYYVYVSGFYMPVLEALILIQFIAFDPRVVVRLAISALLCSCALGFVFAFMFWKTFGCFADAAEWIAVFLWSVETFPQLWLNHRLGNTDGQAEESVVVSFLGKTSDFVAVALLAMPAQNHVKTYFSTATAYLNICQFFYFRNATCPTLSIVVLLGAYSVFFCVKVGWSGLLAPLALLLIATKCGSLCFNRVDRDVSSSCTAPMVVASV
eukprot:TRINITY_DN74164_c0_g1_i1.p1 TRINITY_DN74164_c0_g1~~TRINITY_DN74164_c0_g1_i1.p1  ORF type:complete len:335 (+),score=31.79 TRINITY_DN74164_c0_g1_i1:29-1006(+)